MECSSPPSIAPVVIILHCLCLGTEAGQCKAAPSSAYGGQGYDWDKQNDVALHPQIVLLPICMYGGACTGHQDLLRGNPTMGRLTLLTLSSGSNSLGS